MRACSTLLLVALIGSLYVLGSEACGMVTHNLIAQRARQWYLDTTGIDAGAMIDRHIDALQGGAPFPDFEYMCGDDHDAGEDAHWPPFQAAAAKYIHDKFPQPWNTETEKLVVFFLGVVSHYIADINWHGLSQVPFGQGFLRSLGEQNFNCTGDLCSVAHSKGDTGGEFVSAFQFNLGFFEPVHWYVPANDLVQIYDYAPEYVNKTVTRSSIERCSALFMVGSEAIKIFGADIFPFEVANAPFLPEFFTDFFLGGIDDMSVWSSFMWNRMLDWAEHGPPSGPLPHLGTPQERARSAPSKDLLALVRAFSPVLEKHGARLVKSEASERGVSLVGPDLNTMDADVLQDLGAVLLEYFEARAARDGNIPDFVMDRVRDNIAAKVAAQRVKLAAQSTSNNNNNTNYTNSTDAGSSDVPVSGFTPVFEASGLADNAYFGKSLCGGDLNGDGQDDLVVGSPGLGSAGHPQVGAITVFLGGDGTFTEALTINGTMDYARFGWRCVMLDFNLDGVQDLVVSAPSAGGKDLEQVLGNYTGAVHVFFGQKSPASPAGIISSSPDVIITSTTPFANVGFTLAAEDLACSGTSKMLVIGSPYYGIQDANVQEGAVWVFAPSKAFTTGTRLDISQANLTLSDSPFSWFGASVTSYCPLGNVGRGGVLVVGAPGFHCFGNASDPIPCAVGGSAGAIKAFIVQTTPSFAAGSLYNITGREENAKYGWAVDAITLPDGTPLLAVSAPSGAWPHAKALATGFFSVYNVSSLVLGRSYRAADIHSVDFFLDESWFARLGWQVDFYPKIIDNTVYLSSPRPFHLHETGEINVWTLNLSDNLYTGWALQTFHGSPLLEMFGATSQFLGDAQNNVYVACGAPHAHASRAGLVQVFQVTL